MRNDLTKFKGIRSLEKLKQQMVNIVQFRQTLKKKKKQSCIAIENYKRRLWKHISMN